MKRKMFSILLCIVMVLALTSTAGTKSSTKVEAASKSKSNATTATFAKISTGGVIGYKTDGINTFLGIPYATAKRFEMPQRISSWTGYRQCFLYGEVCPQNKTVMNKFDTQCYSNEMVENENSCLNLNVWTPDMKPAKKKPVIVWLHGGGYASGASNEATFYSGANLAKYGDVVFVSINHRLNVLGYLDLSAYGDQFKNSGNAGMADIVSALQWVKENISKFGGDPSNVIIEGQSGGGGKVTTLMGMPAAKGLFQKAVAQSGGSVKVTRTTATAQADTEKLLTTLGLTGNDIDKLQTMSYTDLYNAASKAGILNNMGPVVDGDYYPDGTYKISKDIPFMCGNVMGEFFSNYGNLILGNAVSKEAWEENSISKMSDKLIKQKYTEKFGDKADAIMTAFKKAYPGHNVAEALYLNDRNGGFSAKPLASAMESYGGKAYNYVVAYNYPMFGGVVPVHTMNCVPFFFHNMSMVPAWIAGDEKTANKVSDQMATALVNFAYTGNPSQKGLKWVNYTDKKVATMVFDSTSEVRYNFDTELFNLIESANTATTDVGKLIDKATK